MKLYFFSNKQLNYVPAHKRLLLIIFTFFLLGVLLSFIYLYTTPTKKQNEISEEIKLIVLSEFNKFDEDKFKNYLNELNIKFPHIVYAQAKLESNNFKSKIFKENNNMFGMKAAKQRQSTNKGEQYGHAYFDTWKDCVVDYALFQAKYLSSVKSESDYFNYLGENYAEDSSYVSRLKDLINKNNLKELFNDISKK